MQIHELKVKGKKSRKRIGRGGKRGTYSGKGMKGQKARSGGNVDPLFEGGRTTLIDKLKKVRGFKAIVAKKSVVNLEIIDKKFKNGDTVSLNALVEAGAVQKSKAGRGVKILGNGKLKKKLYIDKEILLSKSAKEAIEKAGGSIGKKLASGKEKGKMKEKPSGEPAKKTEKRTAKK
jgi:large subunit ribosomal protein L15